jgi:hypothetical protein
MFGYGQLTFPKLCLAFLLRMSNKAKVKSGSSGARPQSPKGNGTGPGRRLTQLSWK